MLNRELLVSFLRTYPFQPATALWRTVEIDELCLAGLPGGRGLDLGCGDGKLTKIILDRAGPRRLVGIDPDPLEAELADRLGIYEAVHNVGGDRVPEDDGSFDFVISNSVLEHIEDLEPVLAEAARLLRAGGRFAFTVPSAGFHGCLRGALWPNARRDAYLRDLDKRLAHCRYPTAQDWEAMLAGHGLKLEGIKYYLSEAEVRRWETLSRFTGGLLYALFRKKNQPIEIQRKFGMRGFQSRFQLPAFAAGLAARIVAWGLNDKDGALTEAKSGCVLLTGCRA